MSAKPKQKPLKAIVTGVACVQLLWINTVASSFLLILSECWNRTVSRWVDDKESELSVLFAPLFGFPPAWLRDWTHSGSPDFMLSSH